MVEDIQADVAAAIRDRQPVVALESTLIAHGLPWPTNIETALAAEQAVRQERATPATIAIINGRPTIGLSEFKMTKLARDNNVMKASRRDLAVAVAAGRTAATTVSGTMVLAHRVGIRVFATGGIGGVHRGAESTFDISADLTELARTPVAVVCAGVKNILDIAKTLELLETLGVPVVGYQCSEFPAFYLRSSGLAVSARVDSPAEAARMVEAHFRLAPGGVVIAQPVAEPLALEPAEFESAMAEAVRRAGSIKGAAITPALLTHLAQITNGKTLHANRELIVENARLAARIAREMANEPGKK